MSAPAAGPPRLTLARVWPLLALGFAFAFAASHPVRPHDFWWHLRAGDDMLAGRAIPMVDTLSFTRAGAPYDSYASFWLVETAYSLLYGLGGLPLIITVHAVLLTLAYGLTLRAAYLLSGSLRSASFCALFAIALGIDNWNLRPQTAGYLFFALCLWAVVSYRQRPRRWVLCVPPAAIALWANCHGSFFLGLVLIGLWLAAAACEAGWRVLTARGAGARAGLDLRGLRVPALLLGASLAASLVNPRGPGIYGYVGAISGNAAVRQLVIEWQPPGLDSAAGAFFILAVLGVAALLAASPRRPDAFTLLTYVAFALLGFTSSRSVVWFGLAVAPLSAAHLVALGGLLPSRPGRARPTGGRAPAALNATIAGLVVVGAGLSLPWFKAALPLSAEKAGLVSLETPVDAVAALTAARLPGHIFHDEATGSYLTWAAPDYPVYIDTRIELYPLEQWAEYFEISAATAGWEERLTERGINTLLLSRDDQARLIEASRRSGRWAVVWEDARFVVLTRRES